MKQDLGETRAAMMAEDEKDIQSILSSRPVGRYWIVLFYKPLPKEFLSGNNGESVIRRVIKAYDKKPETPQLGTVVLEVLNGEVVGHEIYPHDAPIDWAGVTNYAGLIETPYTITSAVAGAYIYN